MEEGFQDAITDASDRHPVHADEYHCTIGVVDDDVGMYSIQHLTKEDKG
jgi:hypothetical protein